jgi:hypothetical protein
MMLSSKKTARHLTPSTIRNRLDDLPMKRANRKHGKELKGNTIKKEERLFTMAQVGKGFIREI